MEGTLTLPRRSIEVLLDLLDNRLTDVQVIDREDARSINDMEAARRELSAALFSINSARYVQRTINDRETARQRIVDQIKAALPQ